MYMHTRSRSLHAGEKAVRDLYATAPAGLSYTIVRPGLLSVGEMRGARSVEFNQVYIYMYIIVDIYVYIYICKYIYVYI